MQLEDGRLEDLLKEVAETEIPADTPTAPPHPIDEDIEMTDVNMLPSQRDKCNNWIDRATVFTGLDLVSKMY